MTIPDWLFKEPIEHKTSKIYEPKTLKQIARDIIKLDDKQLNKKLDKKMLNPYYFTAISLKVGFKIILDTHHINHTISKLTITANYLEVGIEIHYFNKISKDLSVNYARLINQKKFRYQTVFSARIDKQVEDNQVLDETELFINLNINHKLTETDIGNIDVKSPSEHQIPQQELKISGWRFDKIDSVTKYFSKTDEMNGLS